MVDELFYRNIFENKKSVLNTAPGTLAEVSRAIDFEIYYKVLTLFGKGTVIFNLKNTMNLEFELFSRTERDKRLADTKKKINQAKDLGYHLDVSYKELFKDVRRKSVSIRGSRNSLEEQNYKNALSNSSSSSSSSIENLASNLGVPRSWLYGISNIGEDTFGDPPSNLLFLGIDLGNELIFYGDDLTSTEAKQMKIWREKENWRSSEIPNVTDWSNVSRWNEEMFFSRTNHVKSIWLLDGEIAFESFCIQIENNVEVVSCCWTAISSMPFRTSKEFITLMSSDDVFRSKMLILEKDDLKNEYCKLFFERLVEDIKQRTYNRFLPDLHLKKGMTLSSPF